jgi:predicted NUDIX family phosphoesterase
MDQMVLVFEAAIIEHLGMFQGYTLEVERYLSVILDPGKIRFIPRSEAEQNFLYKQLIPYVVLRFRDSVFSYVRGKQSNEARLRAKRSIGLGGHIEYKDYNLFSYSSPASLYYEAVKREIQEEIDLDVPYVEHVVALINDNSNEVGKVHFGVVHIWDLAEPKVRKRESQITQASFATIKDLMNVWDELETWSQITIEILRDPRIPPYTLGRSNVIR